ncbi:MAG UNVERIFIED_CONTAM: ATP-binding protein [Anaerolineae bacterium]
MLLGASGTGKTHLAAAIGNQCEQDGMQVMFLNVADLLDYLRQTFSPNSSTSFDARFQQVKDAPLLILDDFRGSRSEQKLGEGEVAPDRQASPRP